MVKLFDLLMNGSLLSQENREKLAKHKAMNRTNTMVLYDPDKEGGGPSDGTGCYSNLPISPTNPSPRCK